MPSYITLTIGPKTRILRLSGTEEAVTLTSLADKAVAKELAAKLTWYGEDIPWLIYRVLTETGLELPDPAEHEYDAARSRDDWLTEPAPTGHVDATRRLLAAYDQGSDGTSRSGIQQINAMVANQPEPVRRAIRDELATWAAPYDGIQVVGYVYDRKWNDCSWTLLLTGALNQMSAEDLERVVTGDAGCVIDHLEDRGDVEVPDSVHGVADNGYLELDPHPGQLRAWLTAHQPTLLDKFEQHLASIGL